MQLDLDVEAVRSFVIFRNMNLSPRRDVPPRADPVVVARRAVKLTSHALGGLCDGDQCRVAECSGLLVYAMDGYGLNYEEVCQLASRKVAEVLRQITPDHRQTEPVRHMALRSAVGQADAYTLIVKLAEIRAVIERIPQEYDTTTAADRALDLKNWVDRVQHLLEAMRALKEMPRMRPALAQVRTDLTQITRFTEQAKIHVKDRAQTDAGPNPLRESGRPDGVAVRKRSRSVDRPAAFIG